MYKRVLRLLNLRTPKLESAKFRIALCIGALIFALIFLYLFRPFGMDYWIDDIFGPKVVAILYICAIALIISAASQTVQYFAFRGREYRFKYISTAILVESLTISLPLSMISVMPHSTLLNELGVTFPMVLMTMVLCYTISYLTLYYLINTPKPTTDISLANSQSNLLSLYDEAGQPRLILPIEDLLMFEAEDNYVVVHYMAGDNYKRMMIRSTMKKVEEQSTVRGCVRCHRSFIVNVMNITRIYKKGRLYEIEVRNIATPIPVSLSYQSRITRLS